MAEDTVANQDQRLDEQSAADEQGPQGEQTETDHALIVAPAARTEGTGLFAPGAHPARFVAAVPQATETQSQRSGDATTRRLLIGLSALLLVSMLAATALLVPHTLFQRAPTSATRTGQTYAGGSTTPGSGAVAPLPQGMPTHFAFGVQNASGNVGLLNSMRATNGTAWDFRSHYLSGGVDTGKGWETWSRPIGEFARLYATESATNGYLPVFVYDEMLQSGGACASCDDAERDLANLDDAKVMRAYFANWRLLLQQLSTFGKPALVIVEPELWGYMQRSVAGTGGLGDKIAASVAASGDADAAALPNTAQGFAWALLAMRDRYAPNVMLALNVSNWASGDDLNTSTSLLVDVSGVASETAQFLGSVGLSGTPAHISTWDLLSNDLADQDSGQGNAWWDTTNQSYPNFARYLSFASQVTRLAGRRMLLWQVPEGNQYFATMNNTPHHTQDNRAQYLLSHVGDFARAGIIGAIFGANDGGTSVEDAAGDGVSNAAPVQSYECDRCNTHLSTYPDDDGGYLRIFVGSYYRHGALQLANPSAWTPAPAPAIATVTPLPAGICVGTPRATIGHTITTPNPISAGQTVTVSTVVTMNCDADILVQAEVDNANGRLFTYVQDKIHAQQNQPTTIQIQGVWPANVPAGTYLVSIGVHSPDWSTLYEWKGGAASIVVR